MDWLLDLNEADFIHQKEKIEQIGNFDYIKYLFLDKKWNLGLKYFCLVGDKDMVDLFIFLGANNWIEAIKQCISAGREELALYLMIKRGMSNSIDSPDSKGSTEGIIGYSTMNSDSKGSTEDIIGYSTMSGYSFPLDGVRILNKKDVEVMSFNFGLPKNSTYKDLSVFLPDIEWVINSLNYTIMKGTDELKGYLLDYAEEGYTHINAGCLMIKSGEMDNECGIIQQWILNHPLRCRKPFITYRDPRKELDPEIGNVLEEKRLLSTAYGDNWRERGPSRNIIMKIFVPANFPCLPILSPEDTEILLPAFLKYRLERIHEERVFGSEKKIIFYDYTIITDADNDLCFQCGNKKT